MVRLLYFLVSHRLGRSRRLGGRVGLTTDGKNIVHLYDRIFIPSFIRLYHDQILLPAALEPGLPAETPERALFMWIAWLIAGYGESPFPQSSSSTSENSGLHRTRPWTEQRNHYIP